MIPQTSVVDALFFSAEGARAGERERALCKLGLVNLRQFQAFLGVLLEDLIACNNRLAKLDQDLLSTLLQVIINYFVTISTDWQLF